jgi:hypothetical protein
MNANRALGLLAALLVTAAQAMVFAVDTSAHASSATGPRTYDAALGAQRIPEDPVAYGGSRGPTGG